MIEIDWKRIKKWNILLIYLLLSILVFSIGKFACYSRNGSMIMDDSIYDILRAAHDQDIYDELSHRNYAGYSQYYLKMFLPFGDQWGVVISELFLLLIITTLVFLIVQEEMLLFGLILISPFFINRYLALSDFSIAITLLLFIVILSELKKDYLIIPLILLLGFLNFSVGLFFVMYCLWKSYYEKKNIFLPSIYCLFLVLGLFLVQFTEIIPTVSVIKGNIIFEFGANMGLPILIIIMGLIGFYNYYKDSDSRKIVTFLILGLAFGLYNKDLMVFIVGSSLIFFTWKMVNRLLKRKWELDSIKTISVYMIFCALLFSFISGISLISLQKFDNRELLDGLNWIKENTSEKDIIMINPRFSSKLKYIANRGNFEDYTSNDMTNLNKSKNEYSELVHSRNIEDTKKSLDNYNVSYIIVTPEIKLDYKLKSDSDGILFILQNYDDFNLVYINDFVKIYRYQRLR